MFVELLKPFLGKTVGERIHVSPEEGAALVASGVAREFKEDPLTPVITKGVEKALEGFQKGLDGIITATLKQFAQAQKLANKHATPILFGEGGEGDPRGKTFGDWALAVARKDAAYLEKHYGSHFNEWKAKTALGESSGVTGGYTVPPDFYQGLMSLIVERSIVRPRAYVQPMASATLQIPYLDVTTVQAAGTSPFFGGVKMNWTAEAQARTENEPQFKQMELRAWELSGYSVSSNVLLQDSVVGLEKFLMTLFSMAIAWFEDFAFIQGNGAGKPQGMVTANSAISVTRTNTNLVQFQDVANMWSKLLPHSWQNAIWMFSPTVVPQLLRLQDGANRAIFISVDQGAVKTPQWALLGRPAIPTEKLPALGSSYDIALVDPTLYVIGDRMSIEVAASEHVNFLNNQMTWRVVERVDGQPWLDKPITLQDASTQVSPFVYLHS
jgi:HK97 family phage major capsid protein